MSSTTTNTTNKRKIAISLLTQLANKLQVSEAHEYREVDAFLGDMLGEPVGIVGLGEGPVEGSSAAHATLSSEPNPVSESSSTRKIEFCIAENKDKLFVLYSEIGGSSGRMVFWRIDLYGNARKRA